MSVVDTMENYLRDFGLCVRGKAIPAENQSRLYLIGSIGDKFFAYFKQSPEYKNPTTQNSLDNWSQNIIDNLCEKLQDYKAEPIYPFDSPAPPFQSWALASDSVHKSPLGILIHSQYGLWHAYRGAIKLNPTESAEPEKEKSPQKSPPKSPCENCPDKPCLHSCPVLAFSEESYDVAACANHLGGENSGPCFAAACLARRACPIAQKYAYKTETSQFFMQSFRKTIQKHLS